MRKSSIVLLGSACVVAGAAIALGSSGNPDLPVVPDVNLDRYQGKWYEIARLPARFENACVSDVTAHYALRPDKTVKVVNQCRRSDGTIKRSDGVARKKDRGGPASKLKVQFFWPFNGDYWILQLDPDYRWALVGTPDRRYLWILSRQPHVPGDVYKAMMEKARTLGFNTDRVKRTTQSAN